MWQHARWRSLTAGQPSSAQTTHYVSRQWIGSGTAISAPIAPLAALAVFAVLTAAMATRAIWRVTGSRVCSAGARLGEGAEMHRLRVEGSCGGQRGTGWSGSSGDCGPRALPLADRSVRTAWLQRGRSISAGRIGRRPRAGAPSARDRLLLDSRAPDPALAASTPCEGHRGTAAAGSLQCRKAPKGLRAAG
jgi:hypothetical protein